MWNNLCTYFSGGIVEVGDFITLFIVNGFTANDIRHGKSSWRLVNIVAIKNGYFLCFCTADCTACFTYIIPLSNHSFLSLTCNLRKSLCFFAATKQINEWFSPSVGLPVRPSVSCHTRFTMFSSLYHHKIRRSYYHWQQWCPCKRSILEGKGQGHRGKNPI